MTENKNRMTRKGIVWLSSFLAIGLLLGATASAIAVLEGSEGIEGGFGSLDRVQDPITDVLPGSFYEAVAIANEGKTVRSESVRLQFDTGVFQGYVARDDDNNVCIILAHIAEQILSTGCTDPAGVGLATWLRLSVPDAGSIVAIAIPDDHLDDARKLGSVEANTLYLTGDDAEEDVSLDLGDGLAVTIPEVPAEDREG